MATAVFACGAECQHIGHWTTTAGAPTVSTTIFRHPGAASWEILTASAVQEYLQHTFAVTTVKFAVLRAYVMIVTAPSVATECIMISNAANSARINIDPVGGTFKAGYNAGTQSTGPAYQLNKWYLLEMYSDLQTGTATLDWRVDGVAQSQATFAQATTACTGARAGFFVAAQGTIYVDDIVASQTIADYTAPGFGPGWIQGFLVGATSGTHNQTAGDLKDEAGTNLSNGDATGSKINEVIPTLTNYAKQVVLRTTSYAEYIYSGTTTGYIPRAVEQVVAVSNVSGTTANTEKSQLYDGTTATDAYALTNVGSASLVFRRKMWATAPTGAWTTALFAATRIRWGFVGTLGASVPLMTWTILEAEFPGDPLPMPYVGGGYY